MPFTPYHFGPSVFFGLVFRKWIDLPVFVLTNVIIDFEVLFITRFRLGYPIHRYFHTLLLGTAVGILWALLAYPMRALFKKIMSLCKIPYKTSLFKMIISGIAGAWLHVLSDSAYHWDVRIFWPSNAKPLWNLLTQHQVKIVCLICFALAIPPYILAVRVHLKNRKLIR